MAFLAGGVDRPYPRGHEGLLDRIAATGAVWSETPCGAAPTKWRFLARNRLIAALADAVVVIEAGWCSGSLNTAGHAADPAPSGTATDENTRLFDALSPRSARSVADVARRSGLARGEAEMLLGFAELEGRAVRDDGGAWRSVGRSV